MLPLSRCDFGLVQYAFLPDLVITLFGLAKQIPATIFIGRTNPCAETAVDPTTRRNGCQSAQSDFFTLFGRLGFKTPGNFTEGGQLNMWMPSQCFIKLREEIVAVVWIIFPRILAIQNYADHGMLFRIAVFVYAFQFCYKIFDGISSKPFGVVKTDFIGEAVVTEKPDDFMRAISNPVRLV